MQIIDCSDKNLTIFIIFSILQLIVEWRLGRNEKATSLVALTFMSFVAIINYFINLRRKKDG